jgi:hypothetical protein
MCKVHIELLLECCFWQKKEGLSTLPFPLWHVCVCVITFRPLALPLSRDVGSGAWNWEVYNGRWFLLGCICESWYWVFVWRINQTVWKLQNVAWLLIGGLLTCCWLFSLRYGGECVGHVNTCWFEFSFCCLLSFCLVVGVVVGGFVI